MSSLLQRMALRRLGFYYDGHVLPSACLLPGVAPKQRGAPLRQLERRRFAMSYPDKYWLSRDWVITPHGRKAYEHLLRTGDLPPLPQRKRKPKQHRVRKLIPYAGAELEAA